MRLTETQRDALAEIANVGTSKAAKQLSLLLSDSVQMSIPKVSIGSPAELPAIIGLNPDDQVAGVVQRVSGALNAGVILLFPSRESRVLVQSLIGDAPPLVDVDMRAYEHEAITEIGNIIVSASVSSIADLLGGTIKLSLPRYSEGRLDLVVADGRQVDVEGELHVLVMETQMRATHRDVTGSLLITFPLADLEALLGGIDRWISEMLSGGR